MYKSVLGKINKLQKKRIIIRNRANTMYNNNSSNNNKNNNKKWSKLCLEAIIMPITI